MLQSRADGRSKLSGNVVGPPTPLSCLLLRPNRNMGNTQSIPQSKTEYPKSSECTNCTSSSIKNTSIDSDSTYCEPDPSSKRPCILKSDHDTRLAYEAFLRLYPEYRLTWTLDNLRETDFARLDRMGETYVDYMGGAVYPDRLVQSHSTFLAENIMGNTHSVSNR